MRYLPDTTAPHLTAGGVSRNSDSEGTVKFTSDEAGQYYYQVVAAGDAPPAIDSSGPGIACGTSEETINLVGLNAGGHDIYIIVKDEAGNVSDALRIAIPALLSGKLNPVLRGWANYYRIANCRSIFAKLMSWIRRRLRMKQMREWKSYKQLHKALRRRGYKGEFRKISMTRWRNSTNTLANMALPNSWFDEIGLINLGTYKTGTLSFYYER